MDKKALVVLFIILVGSLVLRIVPQLDFVFTERGIVLQEVDPYYHMRLTDYLMNGGTLPWTYEPFLYFSLITIPGLKPVLSVLTWFLSKVLFWVPYQTIAVFIPPVIGVATVFVFYLLCLEILKSSKWALLATMLMSILPTEFLNRTMVGFYDHHCLEVLLYTSILLCISKYIRTYKARWALIGGGLLGTLMLTWEGAIIHILIFSLLSIGMVLIGGYQKYKYLVLLPIIGLSPILLGPNWFFAFNILIIVIPVIVLTLLGLAYAAKRTQNSKSLVKVIVGVPLVLTVLFIIVAWILKAGPLWSLFLWGIDILRYLTGGTNQVMGEAIRGNPFIFTFQFGVVGLLSLMGLGIAIVKKWAPWFLYLALTLFLLYIGQVRWSYYLVLPITILAVYGLRTFLERIPESKLYLRQASLVVITLFLFIVSLGGTILIVGKEPLYTTNWQATCLWLRNNTEEPFTSTNPYYKMEYGVPKYSVLAWWDYGHWILKEAQRVPLSSPGWFNEDIAKYLISQPNENEEMLINNLKVKYVIIDQEDFNGKFGAIVVAAGKGEQAAPTLQINSMAARLWREEVPGYSLVHQEGNIKVLERRVR